jgi:hypothetical protein
MQAADPQEVEDLERVAAWRRRLVDADPSDAASLSAADLLERIAEDLRHNPYADLRTELQAIGNWLGEGDLISDYAELAEDYRQRIGISETPADGAAYLQALLAIARSLI